MVMNKYCSKCQITKSVYDFNNDRTARDGKCYQCRSCGSINSRDWKIKNRVHYYLELCSKDVVRRYYRYYLSRNKSLAFSYTNL